MGRALLLSLGLVLAGCANAGNEGRAPEGLALTDDDVSVESSTEQSGPVMQFDIDGETFDLPAGICNTYENGTFRFALAEGPIGETGRATATIERFDTGVGHEMILAIEGTRDDGTSVTWYAQESVSVHRIVVSIFGGSIEGSALFDSIGGPDAPGKKADGTYSIRCT